MADPVGDLGIDPAWLGVGATIVGLVCVQSLWGPVGDLEVMARMGAWTAAEGFTEPWRLLAYGWLHGSWGHAVSNLLALLAFGWPLERVIGWRRWLLLYTAGVLAGGLAAALLEAPYAVVGASGGIFALWAAMAALAVSPRQMLHGAEVGTLREALWPLGLVMVMQSVHPDVSWGAHLGGLVVGLGAGLSGLLVAGLAPRAPRRTAWDAEVPPVAWGRAVAGTLVVGVCACGFPWLEIVLMLAYVLIIGMVAWREPRYSASDGWAVTLAALGAAGVLWAAGLGSVALGRAWDPQPGEHWIALSDSLPAFRVAFRTHHDIEGGGMRFGREGDALQVELRLIELPEGYRFGERWVSLVESAGPGELRDDEGCPSLVAPGMALVLGPEVAVRIDAFDGDGPVDPEWRGPEGCFALTLDDRLAAREARGDREGAARLRAASLPDDPVAQLWLLAFDLACPERVAALAERVAADASLAVDAGAAAVECPERDVVRWLDAVLKDNPDDGRAWLVRADVAENRGDSKGLRKALGEAVRTNGGDDRARAAQRLEELDR